MSRSRCPDRGASGEAARRRPAGWDAGRIRAASPFWPRGIPGSRTRQLPSERCGLLRGGKLMTETTANKWAVGPVLTIDATGGKTTHGRHNIGAGLVRVERAWRAAR